MAPPRLPLASWLLSVAYNRGLRIESIRDVETGDLLVFICPSTSVAWEAAGRYDLSEPNLKNYDTFRVTLDMMGYSERKLART